MEKEKGIVMLKKILHWFASDNVVASTQYTAALRKNVDDAADALALLPQYIKVNEATPRTMIMSGLLNVLNGCLVSSDAEGLRLTWQAGTYETLAHSFCLRDADAIRKFVASAQAQARAMV